METRRAIRIILIIGFSAAAVSLLIYFFNDGKVNTVGWEYAAGFIGGFLIGWVVNYFLLDESEKIKLLGVLFSTLLGGFIGMGLGQTLRFRLVTLPELATLRSDAYEILDGLDVFAFFDNFRNPYSLNYLLFLCLGMLIGIIGLRRILYVIVKWILDYKQ